MASRADSSSTTTPAAIAEVSSASVLPGPAKLTRSLAIPVSSATRSSPADATSRQSTSPDISWTIAGIGLAFTAYPIETRGPSASRSSVTRSCTSARSYAKYGVLPTRAVSRSRGTPPTQRYPSRTS